MGVRGGRSGATQSSRPSLIIMLVIGKEVEAWSVVTTGEGLTEEIVNKCRGKGFFLLVFLLSHLGDPSFSSDFYDSTTVTSYFPIREFGRGRAWLCLLEGTNRIIAGTPARRSASKPGSTPLHTSGQR